MSYLLDTNHLSALVSDPNGACARRLRAVADEAFTSIIVVAEVWFGLAKNPSERLRALVEPVIAAIRVEPWESLADVHYANVRSFLERKGQPIGSNDLLIAAHALAVDATLLTGNLREFRRVPGLRTENWIG
jgi:tRNA(fMet)-specific endonuclease VapC